MTHQEWRGKVHDAAAWLGERRDEFTSQFCSPLEFYLRNRKRRIRDIFSGLLLAFLRSATAAPLHGRTAQEGVSHYANALLLLGGI